MRTTVDIPDDLFRRAKSEAALQGRKLKDLVEDGLRRVLNDATPDPLGSEDRKQSAVPRKGSLHEAMQKFCGIIDDGPADLSTNPKYFDDFGR